MDVDAVADLCALLQDWLPDQGFPAVTNGAGMSASRLLLIRKRLDLTPGDATLRAKGVLQVFSDIRQDTQRLLRNQDLLIVSYLHLAVEFVCPPAAFKELGRQLGHLRSVGALLHAANQRIAAGQDFTADELSSLSVGLLNIRWAKGVDPAPSLLDDVAQHFRIVDTGGAGGYYGKQGVKWLEAIGLAAHAWPAFTCQVLLVGLLANAEGTVWPEHSRIMEPLMLEVTTGHLYVTVSSLICSPLHPLPPPPLRARSRMRALPDAAVSDGRDDRLVFCPTR